MRDRNEPFVPAASHQLDDDTIDLRITRSGCSWAVFSLTEPSLQYRFHKRRGDGYAGLVAGNVRAVVRAGTRGQLQEIQMLVTYPRRLSLTQSRALLKKISSVYAPDLITHLESSSERGVFAVSRGGYLPLRSGTTPYFKELEPGCMPSIFTLSGMDIHTW